MSIFAENRPHPTPKFTGNPLACFSPLLFILLPDRSPILFVLGDGGTSNRPRLHARPPIEAGEQAVAVRRPVQALYLAATWLFSARGLVLPAI